MDQLQVRVGHKWLPRGSSSGRIESSFVIDFQRYADRCKREETRRVRRMRTVELLDLSDEFARMLRTGEVNRRADLAAIYGMSRARILSAAPNLLGAYPNEFMPQLDHHSRIVIAIGEQLISNCVMFAWVDFLGSC